MKPNTYQVTAEMLSEVVAQLSFELNDSDEEEPAIISLFSGYGGLEMGVQEVIGGRVVAHVEFDRDPSQILAHHWPGVPNLGDVTAVDWTRLRPTLNRRRRVVMTGGFPCQDVSPAGLRRGMMPGTRSGLWTEFARAIDAVRPDLVVIENVRGLLSAKANSPVEHDAWTLGDGDDRPTLRAIGAVLGDLADIGYDARWIGLRASDAGATHARYRIFIVAYPRDAEDLIGERARGLGVEREGDAGEARGSGRRTTEDADGATRGERGVSASGQEEVGRAWADSRGRGRASAPDTDGGERDGRERDAQRGPGGRVAPSGRGQVSSADADRDGLGGVGRVEPAEPHAHGRDGADRARLGAEPAPCVDGHAPDRCEHPTRRGSVPAELWRRGLKPAARAAALAVARAAPPADTERRDLERRGDRSDMVGSSSPGSGRERSIERATPDDRRAEPRRDWGPYGPAVERWEEVLGRAAPAPTAGTGKNGAHRLSALFVEWMMGLVEGHVTGAGLSRQAELKALGNGVVPQQCALATRTLLTSPAYGPPIWDFTR